jgi:hypothetical protein
LSISESVSRRYFLCRSKDGRGLHLRQPLLMWCKLSLLPWGVPWLPSQLEWAKSLVTAVKRDLGESDNGVGAQLGLGGVVILSGSGGDAVLVERVDGGWNLSADQLGVPASLASAKMVFATGWSTPHGHFGAVSSTEVLDSRKPRNPYSGPSHG